ncbi:hypothetical protein KCU59_g71, partial [Aureobasidium melanogenum]
MIYFFVDVVVLLFPPLSSLVVEVLFAELADVISVLPGVLLAFVPEVATAAEAAEDPEAVAPEEAPPDPVAEAEFPLPLPPPPDESSSFCSTMGSLFRHRGCRDRLVQVYSRAIAGKNLDLLVFIQPDDILECSLFVRKNTAGTASAANNLEVDEVNTNVTPASCTVDKLPSFNSTSLRLGDDAILDIGPGDPVDLPFPIAAHEFIRAVDTCLGRWKGYAAKSGW